MGAGIVVLALLSHSVTAATYEPLPANLAPSFAKVPDLNVVVDVGQQLPLFQVTEDHFVALYPSFTGEHELCAFPKTDRRGQGTAWISEGRNLVFGLRTKSCNGKLRFGGGQDLSIVSAEGSTLTVQMERYGRVTQAVIPRPKGFEVVERAPSSDTKSPAGGGNPTYSSPGLIAARAATRPEAAILTDAEIERVMRRAPAQKEFAQADAQNTGSARLLTTSSMHVEATDLGEVAKVPSETLSAILSLVTSPIVLAGVGALLFFAVLVVGVTALMKRSGPRTKRRSTRVPNPIGNPAEAAAASLVEAVAQAPQRVPMAEPPPLPIPRPEECDTVIKEKPAKPAARRTRPQPAPAPDVDLSGFVLGDFLGASDSTPASTAGDSAAEDSDEPLFGGQGEIFELTGKGNSENAAVHR